MPAWGWTLICVFLITVGVLLNTRPVLLIVLEFSRANPAAAATMTAALLTLIGVSISVYSGFRNLIRSHEYQSALVRGANQADF